MISSICIKNIATYDYTGVEIKNLNKVNFIYGANGCGKTTITKCIDNPSDALFTHSIITWKSGIPIKALVYNKDFRDRNFGKGSIEGVFTLGQATKEDLEALQEMQVKLSAIKENGVKKKDALRKLTETKSEYDNQFKDDAWIDVYKKYEETFKEAFTGVLRKDAFKIKLLDQYQNNASAIFSEEALTEKAETIFGERPIAIPPLSTITYNRIVEIENHTIWNKKILGKADIEISKLIQRLNLNDWVNTGRGVLEEGSEICPFCQQETITGGFKRQLDEYFDESFTDGTNLVKSLSNEYQRVSENILNVLQQTEASEKTNSLSKIDVAGLSGYLKTLASHFVTNRELLTSKIKEPSRSIQLVSVKAQLADIDELMKEATNKIQEHNKIVANYSKERSNLIESIWRFVINGYKLKIDVYVKRSSGYQRGIDALETQQRNLREDYKKLDKKIKEANKNVTSVQPSVDEINRLLLSFDFANFKIVPSTVDSKLYQIQREDGTIAEATLSEGEVTFITFLYFLQLCKGSTNEETISDERILVIDDPICSLDSNVLFVVSSLIKEIIKAIKKNEGSIKQLILFTHNVYFHKEVSFVDGRTPMNGDTFFWLLRKKANKTTIEPFEMKNPIHSSYELLWQELKNRDKNSGITVQNTMRRIIENYFKMLGKYADDDLIKSFTEQEEQEICRSLVCWINDGSHCLPDDLYIEHQHITGDKYYNVFRRIFVQMGHEEHFSMMTRENIN